MTAQLDELTEKLRSVEAEIEAELAKRREELRFHLENRRIVFEQEVLRIHRELKTRASRYLIDANPLMILSAPVIYSLIVPIALLDLWVMAYQAICFPIYKIPKVRRRDYLVFDRHHLAYLNIIEKIQLRLLLLRQWRGRVHARSGVAHRSLLVPDQARPPHPRPAPALPGLCRFRRRRGFRERIKADEGRREDRGGGVRDLSSPAKAGDPVRRGFSVKNWRLWNSGRIRRVEPGDDSGNLW